jgi:arsenate reductase (thioredoxin)
MKTILFVCVHNSGRSQMAEAFFNQLAKGKAVGISAGTKPTGQVNPVVVEVMKEVGIDISRNKPKAFDWDIVQKADKMVTMGCGADTEAICPASLVQTEDWSLEDPEGKDISKVREIRDQIKAKVETLIKSL